MSECAYTAHEVGPPAAAAALASLRAAFPPGLLTVAALQPSLPSVRHRYVLGAAPDALIVGFMGTSDARDAVADVNLLQEALWAMKGRTPRSLPCTAALPRARVASPSTCWPPWRLSEARGWC